MFFDDDHCIIEVRGLLLSSFFTPFNLVVGNLREQLNFQLLKENIYNELKNAYGRKLHK